MSTFTMRLSEVLEVRPNIWDDTNPFPIFDEEYRKPLQDKIVDHYINYEIGQETVGMFCHALNRKMREIMPFYNQLYQSELIKIDPLQTMSVTNDSESTGHESTSQSSTTDNTSTTGSKSRSVSSETPQNMLAGNEDYATGAADSVSESNVTGNATGSVDGTADSNGMVSSTTKGSTGHSAVLLMQYRQSFLNIDMNVISDLEPLFMMLWDNGDEFSENPYGGYYYGRPFGWFGSI